MRLLLALIPLLLLLAHPAAACTVTDEDAEPSGVFQAAHPDSKFGADNLPPFPGSGWTESGGGSPPVAFESSGVTMRSWLTIGDFDPAATDANDCWGYTSPSGREYALIGLNTGVGVAEVTDPSDAQVVAHLPSNPSTWRDVKTYQQHAYSVSEGGGGIHVFDLSQIDSGTISDVGNFTAGGTTTSHNVFINEESGRLYRAGGGSSPILGMRIYSLANPAAPVVIGAWHDRYCHDVVSVVWTEPPFVGKEIAFCSANLTASGASPTVHILDVTNPLAITVVGTIDLTVPPPYPASISHQGWLSYDRKQFYIDDEIDENVQSANTLTRVIDIQDLTNPFQLSTFVSTTTARDHDQYARGTYLFQANYRAGLRVLDASDPAALREIAWFDTYPNDDNPNYNSLWSVYPYFASQTILGSDIENGLFVWTLDPVGVPSASWPGYAVIALTTLLSGTAVLVSRRRR